MAVTSVGSWGKTGDGGLAIRSRGCDVQPGTLQYYIAHLKVVMRVDIKFKPQEKIFNYKLYGILTKLTVIHIHQIMMLHILK